MIVVVLLVALTAVCGLAGGWMFGVLSAMEIPQERQQFFQAASIIMLAQDVLGHAASVYFAALIGVSFEPLYSPVLLSLSFFLLVFFCPALGYLSAQSYH